MVDFGNLCCCFNDRPLTKGKLEEKNGDIPLID